jgi:hypothetical protein
MTRLAISTTLLGLGMILPHLKAEGCSNADLQGEYSFLASGALAGMPFATAGQTIYNRIGTAQGVIQICALGAVGPSTTWTATYTVTAMSTGGGKTRQGVLWLKCEES